MGILCFLPLNCQPLCLHVTVPGRRVCPCGTCWVTVPSLLPRIQLLVTFLTRGCGTSGFLPRASLGQTPNSLICTALREGGELLLHRTPFSRGGSPDALWSQVRAHASLTLCSRQSRAWWPAEGSRSRRAWLRDQGLSPAPCFPGQAWSLREGFLPPGTFRGRGFVSSGMLFS